MACITCSEAALHRGLGPNRVDIGAENRGTFRREAQDDALADAGGDASDESDFTLQSINHKRPSPLYFQGVKQVGDVRGLVQPVHC